MRQTQTDSKEFLNSSEIDLDPTTEQESLGWDELKELLVELPSDPCEKFNVLLPLYLDQVCTPEVQDELAQHQHSCQDCQDSYQLLMTFNTHLVQSFEEIESPISQADAEASLYHLLTERWDELSLDELELDELRQTLIAEQKSLQDATQVHSVSPSVPQMIIEGPHQDQRLIRSKRRMFSALISVAAAAILFAYGPNLIETDVGKQLPHFPDATQIASTLTQAQNAPLSKQLGKSLSAEQFKGIVGNMMFKEVKQAPTSDELSTHFIYQVELDGNSQTVDLWLWKLDQEQHQEATKTLTQDFGKLETVTVNQKQVQLHRKQPQPSLQILQYLDQNHLYQFSASVREKSPLLTNMAIILASEGNR